MSKVGDVLSTAFTRANVDIAMLGETMKYAAPGAEGLNISLEELASMAGKLGDAGIQGSEGGTALRSIMSRLASTPKPVAKALHELGIQSKDAQGNLRPLPTLLKEINQRLNLTILIITHEMEVIKRICDKVAVIDKGELVEAGSVAQIFANPQSDLAKTFIKSTFHYELPADYQARLVENKAEGSYPIVKFEFTGESVDAPLLSQATRKFDIDISIFISQIDYAGGVKFGFVIAEIEGNDADFHKTVEFLEEHNVKVEVLGYVK